MRVTGTDRTPVFIVIFPQEQRTIECAYYVIYPRSIAAIVVHVRDGWLFDPTSSPSLWPSIRFPLRSPPFTSTEHVVGFVPEEKKRKRRETGPLTFSTAHTARGVGDFNSTGLLTLGSFEPIITTDLPHPLSCKKHAGLVASFVEPLSKNIPPSSSRTGGNAIDSIGTLNPPEQR